MRQSHLCLFVSRSLYERMASSQFLVRSVLVLTIGLATAIPRLAHAATITVTSISDESTSSDGLCSLREAINNSNTASDTTGGYCTAGTGTDTINFNISGTNRTITVGSVVNMPLPVISSTLTINGSGQNIIIDGGGSYQVLVVASGATLNLNGLTIQNGYIANNPGGAIQNSGTLSVSNSTFSENTAYSGGAINMLCATTISNTDFDENRTTGFYGFGGVIYANANASLNISDSTFSNSFSNEQGGAIYTLSATTIINSTFYNDYTGGYGGAIVAYSQLTVSNSTFSANYAPGGNSIATPGTSPTVSNSILSGAEGGGPNCYMGINNGGYNISDDASCGFGTSTGLVGKRWGTTCLRYSQADCRTTADLHRQSHFNPPVRRSMRSRLPIARPPISVASGAPRLDTPPATLALMSLPQCHRLTAPRPIPQPGPAT
jgi:CSLREA domain-containing protein